MFLFDEYLIKSKIISYMVRIKACEPQVSNNHESLICIKRQSYVQEAVEPLCICGLSHQ